MFVSKKLFVCLLLLVVLVGTIAEAARHGRGNRRHRHSHSHRRSQNSRRQNRSDEQDQDLDQDQDQARGSSERNGNSSGGRGKKSNLGGKLANGAMDFVKGATGQEDGSQSGGIASLAGEAIGMTPQGQAAKLGISMGKMAMKKIHIG